MINYIKEVEKNITLDEGITVIEQFLINIYFENPVSNKVLARKLCLPIPLITAIKKEFIKLGLVIQDRGMSMTPKGLDYVENALGYKGLNRVLYKTLTDLSVDMEKNFAQELDLIKKIFDERPTADVSIDQAHCTYATSLKRSLLALKHNVLIHKKILCVGDDDLVSVSLGFLLKKLYCNTNKDATSFDANKIKSEIHVVDIDKRYLDYIEQLAKTYDLPIICHQVDLKEPLDQKLVGKFDCFYTDPPYTLSGMHLFLSRGIAGLKNIKGIPIFFSFAHKPYDYTYRLDQKLYEMGLCIHKIIPQFNVYEGASIIGNISQMMILYTTSYTNTTINHDQNYIDPLYTREVKLSINHTTNTQKLSM